MHEKSNGSINHAPVERWRLVPYIVAIFFASILIISYVFSSNPNKYIDEEAPGTISHKTLNRHFNLSYERLEKYHIFPHSVHQTWKTRDNLPKDLVRWDKGCQKLNSEYRFNLYDDNDLKSFTHKHYPEYSALFDSLKGVCKSTVFL